MSLSQNKQLEGRDSLLQFDDQYDGASSNPDANALGLGPEAAGANVESTAGAPFSLPSKEQEMGGGAIATGEAGVGTVTAARGGPAMEQDATVEREQAPQHPDVVQATALAQGAHVSARYPEQTPDPFLEPGLSQHPAYQMYHPRASALSEHNPEGELAYQQQMMGGGAGQTSLFENYKSNPALNYNYFTPVQTMASSVGGPGLIKWSDSIAKISQRTEKNLEGLRGLMNSDLPAARDRSMTEQEHRQLNSERGHDEREMDLLDRDKSTESLKKLIQQNQPGALEQDAKKGQRAPPGSRRPISPSQRARLQASQVAPMTPAPKRASILSSLDFYGRYNPISQQGIDLNQQQRRTSPDAFYMAAALDHNDIVHDPSAAFGHQLPPGGYHRAEHQRQLLANKMRSRSAGPRFDGVPAHSPPPAHNNFMPSQQPSPNPHAFREFRSAASLEMRALIDQAKQSIKQFYDMYDQKLKAQLTHPLFRGIDENQETNKISVLTEQVDLLESEMARRIRDLVWAQSLLKKDQIATKKRMGVLVSDKQLDIQLSAFRGHVQEQLSQFSRDLLEMRAMINSQKFEIETRLLNHVRSLGPGRHFQSSQGGGDANSGALRQDASMGPGGSAGLEDQHPATLLTRQAFVQQKSEIYDYLSHQLSDMNTTYSAKLDLLSNFMLQAQDQIRDIQGMKNSGELNVKDISTQLQHRDKVVRDSLHQNSQQLIQLSNTLKDQSGFIMRLKGQLAEMKSQQEEGELRRSEEIASLQGRMDNAEQDLQKKMQAAAAQAQAQQSQQHSQQPIAEVVKQISKLASSLQSFEQDNISKIQRTQKEMQSLQLEISQIKNDLRLGSERQEEAEQSFLKSFQEIKTIVLTKLQVFDKQIESKEEWERMREVLQSEQIVQKALRDQMTALAQKVHEQDENISLMDRKFIEVNDNFSKKNADMTGEMQKLLQDNFQAIHANHEHRLALVENQLRGLFGHSALTSATVGEGDVNRSPGLNLKGASGREGAQPGALQPQSVAPKVAAQLPKYLQSGSPSQSYPASSFVKKDEHSSSYEKDPDIAATKAGELGVAEQQLRDQIVSQHAASPEQTAHKSRNSILDSSTQLRSSNRNQNSAIQVEDQNQEASNSVEVPKHQANKEGRGSITGHEGVEGVLGGGAALKDADKAATRQAQPFEKGSTQSAQQKGSQALNAEAEEFGLVSMPVISEETSSRPSRQEGRLSTPASKAPTRSAERRRLTSNEQSSQSKQGGLAHASGRDQRETMRGGSDDDEEEITNPFITDQDGGKGGIATVTSNVIIGTTGEGFQSSDFKLGTQKQESTEQAISPHQFYASAEQIQPSTGPIEPLGSPSEPQLRPKTKTGRIDAAEVPARASLLASNEEKIESSPPIFVEGSQEGAFEVTGETQNILVMDDKRDESKPSVPSGQSAQSLGSAPSGQTSHRDYQMQSSRSQQTKDKPIILSTFQHQQAIPSSPLLADQDNEKSDRGEAAPELQASSERLKHKASKASMGNSSLEMIHLNSSGETVPPSPHGQTGAPSQKQDVLPQDTSSQPRQPGEPTDQVEKGAMKALDDLVAKERKASGPSPAGAQQTKPQAEAKASPSVQKATQDLKEKVAQERRKQNAKAADQITFEILADTVAKEIAVMLRATVDRNKSKSKKI